MGTPVLAYVVPQLQDSLKGVLQAFGSPLQAKRNAALKMQYEVYNGMTNSLQLPQAKQLMEKQDLIWTSRPRIILVTSSPLQIETLFKAKVENRAAMHVPNKAEHV
ncbi:hypothetical protein AXF42_Ash008613 [Apostasia shenzhenica]|uniref:Uncharacterized protein n=1 Tax=Apostasia shenzhenica TaxID=1088818 RepID=A0A2I0B1X9_9ASPA|nr:hypothetical protein AXF42_Ash008613 [Apostasia shenzhenica]